MVLIRAIVDNDGGGEEAEVGEGEGIGGGVLRLFIAGGSLSVAEAGSSLVTRSVDPQFI